MAYREEEETKYLHGNKNFPILYEDDRVWIYMNPCKEIFVEDVRSGVKMRLNSYSRSDGGLEFTTDGLLEPVQINGKIGWRVSRR